MTEPDPGKMHFRRMDEGTDADFLVLKRVQWFLPGMGQSPRLALNADGSRLAVAATGDSPAITLWDSATGRELRRITGLRGQAAGLAFTPDGRRLVAASNDGTLLVWDVAQ